MGIAWNETETPFAKEVLEFVNREAFGAVAWFKKTEDGTWHTSVQVNGWACIGLDAASEEKLAVEYWNFYFERVENSAKKFSSWWHRLFSHAKYHESQDRLARWIAWRNAHAAQFVAT